MALTCHRDPLGGHQRCSTLAFSLGELIQTAVSRGHLGRALPNSPQISPLKAGHLKHKQSEGWLHHEAPRNREMKPPLASAKQFLLEENHRDGATPVLNILPAPQQGPQTPAPKSQRSVDPSAARAEQDVSSKSCRSQSPAFPHTLEHATLVTGTNTCAFGAGKHVATWGACRF